MAKISYTPSSVKETVELQPELLNDCESVRSWDDRVSAVYCGGEDDARRDET